MQPDFIKLAPQVQEYRALYIRNLDLFNSDYHISPSLLALYCKRACLEAGLVVEAFLETGLVVGAFLTQYMRN